MPPSSQGLGLAQVLGLGSRLGSGVRASFRVRFRARARTRTNSHLPPHTLVQNLKVIVEFKFRNFFKEKSVRCTLGLSLQ